MIKVETIKKQEFKHGPPLSLIIPLKDRCGIRLQNCLRGIQLQTQPNIETIIVDYGSTKENHEQLLLDTSLFDCTIYRYPTDKIWSPAVAKNIGIRRARGTHIATLDADCIMEQRVIENTLKLHKKTETGFVETKMAFLPQELDITKIKLPRDFPVFRENYSLRKHGFGSFLSVHRDWWFDVRGCDERMQGWGGNDDDVRTRVRRSKYNRLILSDLGGPQTMIFHQWHPPSLRVFLNRYGDVFDTMWKRNVAILKNDKTIRRNNVNWGVPND